MVVKWVLLRVVIAAIFLIVNDNHYSMIFLKNRTWMVLGIVVSILIMLPLIANQLPDADARKASGVYNPRYGSQTSSIVCGDRLCSEPEKDPDSKQKNGADVNTKIEESDDTESEPLEETETELEDPSYVESQTVEVNKTPKIARTNLPVTIPMHEGYYDGEFVYYIVTDASDEEIAQKITEYQSWKVNVAPALASITSDYLSKVYVFNNGVPGDGSFGFQGEVFSATPSQPEDYNSLSFPIFVTWNEDIPKILLSEKEILQLYKQDKLILEQKPVVINMAQIVWPDGQMLIKKDKTVDDDTSFVGGQIVDIHIDNSTVTDESTVTFIAHRGWGPDGRTVYFIVLGANPSEPADALAVPHIKKARGLVESEAVNDLFHFLNGVEGVGPWRAQPGIFSVLPTDNNYNPLWRVQVIIWKDLNDAAILQTIDDIDAYHNEELIEIKIARPQGIKHVINAPIIDPFQ